MTETKKDSMMNYNFDKCGITLQERLKKEYQYYRGLCDNKNSDWELIYEDTSSLESRIGRSGFGGPDRIESKHQRYDGPSVYFHHNGIYSCAWKWNNKEWCGLEIPSNRKDKNALSFYDHGECNDYEAIRSYNIFASLHSDMCLNVLSYFPDISFEIQKLVNEIIPNKKNEESVTNIKENMKNDMSFAWSWHCNIAMSMVDQGVDHKKANIGAANFMKMAFDVDLFSYEPYLSIIES